MLPYVGGEDLFPSETYFMVSRTDARAHRTAGRYASAKQTKAQTKGSEKDSVTADAESRRRDQPGAASQHSTDKREPEGFCDDRSQEQSMGPV
ncbi:hypothetical protein MRX96_031081 [Rhipicephalus microplus]